MAAPAQPATVQTEVVSAGVGAPGLAPLGNALPTQPEPAKRAAHYLWAVLIARIYEVFPLLCPLCGGQMRIIAFITHSADIRQILEHIGVEPEPAHISPARGRRCGRIVTRRWVRAPKSSQIGTWRHNRRPSSMSISASIGDWLRRGF